MFKALNWLIAAVLSAGFAVSPLAVLFLLESLGVELGNTGEGGLIMLGFLLLLTLPLGAILVLVFLALMCRELFLQFWRLGSDSTDDAFNQ